MTSDERTGYHFRVQRTWNSRFLHIVIKRHVRYGKVNAKKNIKVQRDWYLIKVCCSDLVICNNYQNYNFICFVCVNTRTDVGVFERDKMYGLDSIETLLVLGE